MEVLKKKCDGTIIEDVLAIQGKNVYLKESKIKLKNGLLLINNLNIFIYII